VFFQVRSQRHLLRTANAARAAPGAGAAGEARAADQAGAAAEADGPTGGDTAAG